MSRLENYRVGFIGLGAMGFGMARNIAKKLPPSTSLTVYDINQQTIEQLSIEFPNRIVKATSSHEVISQSDTILTMLPEGGHVRSIYMDDAVPVSQNILRDKVLLDCSTIDVETCLAIKNHIDEMEPSATFYDAPVSGGVAGADAGTLAFYIGATEQDRHYNNRIRPILLLMGLGEKIIPCGSTSSGLVAKLCHNYLAGVLNVAASETMNLGIRAGIEPQVLYRVLMAGAASNPLVQRENPVPGVVATAASSNGYKPGFRASLMYKDMSLAVALAKTFEADLALGNDALDLYRQVLPKFGHLDFTVVYKLFESNNSSNI